MPLISAIPHLNMDGAVTKHGTLIVSKLFG